MICKKCGAELHPEANFCMKCGAKVEKEIRCRACGATLPEDAAFCFKCGAAQTAEQPAKKKDPFLYDYYVENMWDWVRADGRENWIETRKMLTSVKVEEGMTDCPNFCGMKYLRHVSLPSTLERICGKAFWQTSVERLEIPDGVTEIGSHAFAACRFLQNIKLPAHLRSISRYAFYDCRDDLSIEYRGSYVRPDSFVALMEEAGVELVAD